MWGTYVEGEIAKAEQGAKTTNEAKQKVQLAMNRLLRDDDEGRELPPVGKFRDPSSMMR